MYGNVRTAETKFGTCDVTIPKEHGMGRLEEPLWPFAPRADRHVMLSDVSAPQTRSAAMLQIRERLALSPKKEILLFVHGYRCSFDEAARRIAQIAGDIEFEGVPVMYSWPTTSFLAGYLIDESTSEWTTRYLREFVVALMRESGAERIHILAHSMGSRIVCRALTDIDGVWDMKNPTHLEQIVLAAADLDADLFARDYAPALTRLARHLTVYVSGADWALGGSQRLHYYKRLGTPGSTYANEPWRRKVDIVDVTSHDKGFVGHMYYGDSPRVLDDLRGILAEQSPEARQLKKRDGYWLMDGRP